MISLEERTLQDITLLENVEEYMQKRSKLDMSYSAELSKLTKAFALKFDGSNKETDSSLQKVFNDIIQRSCNIANALCSVASNQCELKDRLEALIKTRKESRIRFIEECKNAKSSLQMQIGENQKCLADYRSLWAQLETEKRKLDKLTLHQSSNMGDRIAQKVLLAKDKAYKARNDYVLSVEVTRSHQRWYSKCIMPSMIDSFLREQKEGLSAAHQLLIHYTVSQDMSFEPFCSEFNAIKDVLLKWDTNQHFHEFETHDSENLTPVVLELEKDFSGLDETDGNDGLIVNEITRELLQEKCLSLHSQLNSLADAIGIKTSKMAVLLKQELLKESSDDAKDWDQGINLYRLKFQLSVSAEGLKCSEAKARAALDVISANVKAPQPLKKTLRAMSIDLPSSGRASNNETVERQRARSVVDAPAKKMEISSKLSSTKAENKVKLSFQGLKNAFHMSPRSSIDDSESSIDNVSVDNSAFNSNGSPHRPLVPPSSSDEWFHGCISRKETESLMSKNGDFLVRESVTKLNQFALSFLWNGTNRHIILEAAADGNYVINNMSFSTINDLLEYHIVQEVPVMYSVGARIIHPIKVDGYRLTASAVELLDKIGEGNFGDVHRGRIKTTREQVAVKTCKTSSSMSMDKFLDEANMLRQYSHPNIVRFIGVVCADSNSTWLVTELMEVGDFLSFLNSKGQDLSTDQLLRMDTHAAAGMEFLEGVKCVHRDLAARNCLVNGDNNVLKISDFGMSRVCDDGIYSSQNRKQIPIKWTSPEALLFAKYTHKSDVWSFGILLWETLTRGCVPYPGMPNMLVHSEVVNGYHMSPPEETPAEVAALMTRCWAFEVSERPNFQEIHSLLRDIIGRS